jgi:hypothetical protein
MSQITKAEADFHHLLNVFAHNSKTPLSQMLIAIYDKAMEPYGYERAVAAMNILIMECRSWQMPTPHQIVEKINNKPSRISEANEVAGRIMQAISDYGYTRGSEAHDFIGDLGWQVVRRFGGWTSLCCDMGLTLDPSSSRAQMRDIALALMDINDHRSIEEAPKLTHSGDKKLDTAVKLLATSKEMPK